MEDLSHSVAPVSTTPRSLETPSTRRRRLWRQIKANKMPYLFISPFFIVYGIFGIFPPLYSLYLSFFRWDFLTEREFIFLDNYGRVLTDDLFWKALSNNLFLILTATVIGLSLAVIIAALVDAYMQWGRTAFMAIYFSPTVTSTVAIAIVFGVLYGTKYGLINAGLQALGLPAVRWLDAAGPLRVALIILLIWRWLGLNILYSVAGLQSISPELYEAAKVDGAVGLQSFFYITLPLIRRTILFMVVISVIGMLQLFGEPAVLTQSSSTLTGGLGGRDNAVLTVVMLMLYNGFSRLRFGYAAAMSYVLFVVILVLSLANLKFLGERE